MVERAGRNDPCPCGSGKKYKSCCLIKEQQKKSPFGGRKFTAKVISGGGVKPLVQTEDKPKQAQVKPIDYTTLMERSFGSALHSHEEKPPVPSNPSEYIVNEDSDESRKS